MYYDRPEQVSFHNSSEMFYSRLSIQKKHKYKPRPFHSKSKSYCEIGF